MISTLREGINKAGSRYVILGMLAIFVFSGTGIFVGLWNRESKGTIARVNSYEISDREFRNKVAIYDARIKELKQQFGQYAAFLLQQIGLSDNPSEMAFNELVQEKLLLNVADNLGIKTLAPSYVGGKIGQRNFALNYLGGLIPPFLYNASGQFDSRALGNYLKRQGISYEQFEQSIETALKTMFVISLLESTGYIFEKQLKNEWLQENSTRTFDVITVSLKEYGDRLYRNDSISKEDLGAYFAQANTAEKRYWTPEKRSGKAYLFNATQYGVVVSDAEVKKEYQDNKERWGSKKFDEVKKEIEKELIQRKFTQRFNADARRVIAQGGSQALNDFIEKHKGIKKELRSVSPDAKDQFAEQLFSIKTVNKNIITFIGNDGCLVVLENIDERKPQKLEEVMEKVKADYIREKTLIKLGDVLNEIVAQSSLNAFTEFAQKNNFAIKKITISGNDKAEWSKLEKEGFPSQRMQKMVDVGGVLIGDLHDGQIKIIALAVCAPRSNEELSTAGKISIRKKTKDEGANLRVNAFIASLQNSAIIEYKDIPKQ